MFKIFMAVSVGLTLGFVFFHLFDKKDSIENLGQSGVCTAYRLTTAEGKLYNFSVCPQQEDDPINDWNIIK